MQWLLHYNSKVWSGYDLLKWIWKKTLCSSRLFDTLYNYSKNSNIVKRITI